MKKSLMVLVSGFYLAFMFVMSSCSDESEEFGQDALCADSQGTNEVVKDYEIKESWLKENDLKSINGDVYAYFGLGLDALRDEDKISVFNSTPSVEPIVSNGRDERTVLKYVVSTKYNEINENISSELSAHLGIDVAKFKLNADLKVENQSSITVENSSVYISVLYMKKYGRSWLQYTSSTINDYLTYSSGINDGGSSNGIPFNNYTFRCIYGDEFRMAMTFGVLMNATIQITDVDFKESSREAVAASAQLAVANMVEADASWEQEKANSEYFQSSSLVINAMAIPRTSGYIYNRDMLVDEIDYLDQCYANEDFGIFFSEYEPYSNLYPYYSFMDAEIDVLIAMKDSWLDAKAKYQLLKSMVSNPTLISDIEDEIDDCDSNVRQIMNLNDIGYAEFNDNILERVFDEIGYTWYLKNGTTLSSTEGDYFGKGFSNNYDPDLVQPLFLVLKTNSFAYLYPRLVNYMESDDVLLLQENSPDFLVKSYILKEPIGSRSKALYRGRKKVKIFPSYMYAYQYRKNQSELINNGYSDDITCIGYIFE